MTRIIAGRLGGRRIGVPKQGTRPTTDRVREAVFSRLDHADAVRGADVIDLFSGSGALGLEALSRAAAHATFVESGPPAARVIEANVKELGLGTRADVVRERALPYLSRLAPSPRWNLAFLDPPYDIALGDMDDVLTALAPLLAPEAALVVEWSRRKPMPDWPRGVELLATKEYGETVVHFAERVG